MTTSSYPAQPATLVTLRDRLPFVVSDVDARPVYAHFMCGQNLAPFVLSGTSNDYWTTTTTQVQNGSAYGALANDRPLPEMFTAPRTAANAPQWQLFDLQNEIRDAIAAGISGFIINSQGGPSANPSTVAGKHWTMVTLLYDAAASVDASFGLILSPDFNTWCQDNPADWALSVQYANTRLNKVLTYGALTVGMYEPWRERAWCTEAYFPAQIAALGFTVHVVPTFNDCYATITRTSITKSKADWAAPFANGLAEWGDRTASVTESKVAAFVAATNARNITSVAPIGAAYHRRVDGFLPITEGTLSLRNSISGASDADWLQLITWNDFIEHTNMCASGGRQLSLLTVVAYLIQQWRTGSPPTVVRDKIIYFQHSHILSAIPSGQPTTYARPRGTPPVEGWFFCTSDAAVSITQDTSIDTQAVTAGLTIVTSATVPDAVPVFALTRADLTLELTSRYKTRSTITYDDPTIKSSDSSDADYTSIKEITTMYGTRAEADAYFATRTGFALWPSGDADPVVTPTVKDKLLTSASDILDTLPYVSKKTSSAQAHEWPRLGYDPTPTPIKQACFEIAYSLLSGKDPEMEFAALGIGGNQYGNVRTNYNQSIAFAHRLTGVLSRRAQVLIQPYLLNDNDINLVRG